MQAGPRQNHTRTVLKVPIGTIPLLFLAMPWDCLFYQCRHNQIFPLLSSGGFESSSLFTERQRGNRRYVEGGSISSSTYLAAKPTLDPLETLHASKHVILVPQTSRGAAERLNLALLTHFCLLSIMQGGHARPDSTGLLQSTTV